jgi:putative flippase GtrA
MIKKIKESKTIRQFVKFFTVGVMNTVVDLLILNTLIFATGKGQNGGYIFSIFKTISFSLAVLNSYFLNKLWVFKGSGKNTTAIQFSSFLTISIISAFINVGVATLVVTHLPPVIHRELWPSIGALCGTGVAFMWNFFGYKYIVFKGKSG